MAKKRAESRTRYFIRVQSEKRLWNVSHISKGGDFVEEQEIVNSFPDIGLALDRPDFLVCFKGEPVMVIEAKNETKKIDDLLEEFCTNKIHMAIVVDEFGGTSGIVTMEDILEEIVGEISDEYDDDEKQYSKLSDGSYIFEAKIQLSDFFRVVNVSENEFGNLTEEVETLAGLLLEIKGDLPERREIIDYKQYRFQILEADNRRILKVKYTELPM